MRRRAFTAATAGVAILALAVAAAAATRYEARSVSTTKTPIPGSARIELSGKVASKHAIAPCYAGVSVRLDRRRANGTWATIRTAKTDAKGLFSWTIVGFTARARLVVPKVTGKALVCAPLILGFDRGYLSPG